MRNIHRHMDGEELEQYSAGTSSPEDAAALEEHLLTCEQCRNQLTATDEYVLAMQSAAHHERAASRAKKRQWSFPAWVPVMAAVACGLLLIVATRRFMAPQQPAVAVSLLAMRGAGSGNIAPARRELLLNPDLTGLAPSPSYRLEVVDRDGKQLRQGTVSAADPSVKFSGLAAGPYFVRVHLPAGELLREYALEIR